MRRIYEANGVVSYSIESGFGISNRVASRNAAIARQLLSQLDAAPLTDAVIESAVNKKIGRPANTLVDETEKNFIRQLLADDLTMTQKEIRSRFLRRFDKVLHKNRLTLFLQNEQLDGLTREARARAAERNRVEAKRNKHKRRSKKRKFTSDDNSGKEESDDEDDDEDDDDTSETSSALSSMISFSSLASNSTSSFEIASKKKKRKKKLESKSEKAKSQPIDKQSDEEEEEEEDPRGMAFTAFLRRGRANTYRASRASQTKKK